MINGAPGNMATMIMNHALKDKRYNVLPYSLTGSEILESEYNINSFKCQLIHPHNRDQWIKEKSPKDWICIDFTLPASACENAEFYCINTLPFVMGTTGGDQRVLESLVKNSQISAVIAPNMAKQIVALQAMITFAAENFPDVFKGYNLSIVESHQHTKVDTSGTAKAFVNCFNKLGIPFKENQIIKVRDPIKQKELGVPQAYLKGHAWHTYTLKSSDETASFMISHNINGRDIYASGTLDAVEFLSKKLQSQTKGKVFSMIDVLIG